MMPHSLVDRYLGISLKTEAPCPLRQNSPQSPSCKLQTSQISFHESNYKEYCTVVETEDFYLTSRLHILKSQISVIVDLYRIFHKLLKKSI
jgi:hypothetical protein